MALPEQKRFAISAAALLMTRWAGANALHIYFYCAFDDTR